MWGLREQTHLCLACCTAFLLLSSSSLRLASSSCVRGFGAGLGGMAGSWMKGWEGWTWADDAELGMAGAPEDVLLRSCAETQGWTAPGRSTDVGRGASLQAAVLLELLALLPLEDRALGMNSVYHGTVLLLALHVVASGSDCLSFIGHF